MAFVATIRLLRPKHWFKSAFVLVGPLYALGDPSRHISPREALIPALFAAGAFALASSACYIVNDVMDVESDRLHPRKCKRPIASGEVSPQAAGLIAVVLTGLAAACCAMIGVPAMWWVAGLVALYTVNVVSYSVRLKHMVIADVVSLSGGFVLRVLGGCAAAGVSPSTWLLNCTLFFAMFLAFGKRLGERRTVEDAGAIRAVQAKYTDELLRMSTVVTGVALMVTYAGYVESRHSDYTNAFAGLEAGFNMLWFTMIPAVYGILRSIVLLESGTYDDPTEILSRDLPMQLSVVTFGILTMIPWIMKVTAA
jgi:4-hydroxybenzoate polyprenyltransferase